jgi:hypothetical protein
VSGLCLGIMRHKFSVGIAKDVCHMLTCRNRGTQARDKEKVDVDVFWKYELTARVAVIPRLSPHSDAWPKLVTRLTGLEVR